MKKKSRSKCLMCGEECKRHTTKFCSQKCSNAYRSKNKIRRGGPKKQLKEIECPWCKKIFMPTHRTTKYCSLKCSGLHRYHVRGYTEFLDEQIKNPYYRSPEIRLKLAKATAKRNKENNNPVFFGRGGIREDIGHYVRSRWEANICRLLNYLSIPYEYEPDTFNLIYKEHAHCYTPDMKIGDNAYIEVKGYETEKAKKKRELMDKLHPEVKILIIDEKKYRIIAKHFKNIIPNWEKDRKHGI